MTDVFGPRLGSFDVETAIAEILTDRLPTYVDKMARRRGIDPAADDFPIRTPNAITSSKEFAGWPETHLPFVQVVCPGTADAPKRKDGLYTSYWQVNVFLIVSARDHAATRRVRSVWEDAIGWCMLQSKSLGGICTGMDWLGESSADVPVDVNDARTLQGSVVVFSVEIPDVLDPNAGPAVFLPDPGDTVPTYPDDPEADEVIVDYTPEELT